jgi:hypothetical protein
MCFSLCGERSIRGIVMLLLLLLDKIPSNTNTSARYHEIVNLNFSYRLVFVYAVVSVYVSVL